MTDSTPHKSAIFEPLWPVQLAVLVALVLQLLLPDRFVAGPKYILPMLEGALLVSLVFTTPKKAQSGHISRRINAVALCAIISLANVYGLWQVVVELLSAGHITNGHELIAAALGIYITNVIIFSLWYWEIDGGGPALRARGRRRPEERDFLFPQTGMMPPPANWRPLYLDYLYVSITNATAFSPTDTMPLRRGVKMLMALQALSSLVTIALVAARAVNILT